MLTSHQRQLAVGVSALIVAVVFLISALAPARGDDVVLAVALVLDIALLAGGTLLYLRRKHGDLRNLVAWKRVARGVAVTVVLLALVARVAGLPVTGWLVLPFLLLEAAIGVIAARTLWRTWRGTSNDKDSFWEHLQITLEAQLPSGLAGAVVSELRLLHAGLRSVTLRPVRRPEGHTATQTSSYGAVMIGLLLATAAEMTAVHLGLAYYLDEGHGTVHLVVLLVHLYGIAWMFGDWRVMRETAHRVVDDELRIDLGIRWRGAIPLDAIAEVTAGEVPTLDVLAGAKRPPHVLAITPLDTPNLTLRLTRPIELRTYFGLRRSGTEILLFVDEPQALRSELDTAMHIRA